MRRVTREILAGALLAAASPAPAAQTAEPAWLTEITAEATLEFIHDPAAGGEFLLPEIMGSGGGFLDFDNDEDLDIYLIQAAPDDPNRLFRQEPGGTFTDVTREVGGGDTGYGMGMAVGDYDNDGFVDLLVTNYGPNRLYRNQEGRRLMDVTEAAGIQGDGWSASATFCDYDGDGFLDLFVGRYVRYDPTHPCRLPDGRRDYCSPKVFPGTPDLLYHNNGDGTFTDVSDASGISRPALPALGVVCADFTGDPRPEIYVANDGHVNHLWVLQRDGTFRDEALFAGVAVNSVGQAQASMGVALGDVDGDGQVDLFLSHLSNETNTLYMSRGAMGFEDDSSMAGVAAPSLPRTGFGTGFFDLEHDGDVDLAVVNGRVTYAPPRSDAGVPEAWRPFAEPNLLFRNDGKGRFEDISGRAGTFGRRVEISRALALGDVDRDGDVDFLVSHTAGPARLFRNDAPKAGHWLQVRAVDPRYRRDAYGTRITVEAGGRQFVRWSHPGYGYLTSNDPRAHFGLPGSGRIDRILVRWPDGTTEAFPGGMPDRSIVLRRGDGGGKAGAPAAGAPGR